MDIGARSENIQPGQVDTIIKVLRMLVVMLISSGKVAREGFMFSFHYYLQLYLKY